VNPNILYNKDKPNESLLNRIMEKADHYSIEYVSPTIANIQRTFTFDDMSLYDAFNKIAEEINCLFVFNSGTKSDGKIARGISVYDLESNCLDCGHRGEFTQKCPKCNSENIDEGYGEDTTIFVTADEIAKNIKLSTDTGAVKNCFKLQAGDDLLTATIRNCNPNGTDYIWYLSNAVKEDMSEELKTKIAEYDVAYENYRTKARKSNNKPWKNNV
jgi:Zn finger protein HypA/HybF involved in hydrogenase expression